MVLLKDKNSDKIVTGYAFCVVNSNVSNYTTEVLLHEKSIGWFWENVDYFEPYNKD